MDEKPTRGSRLALTVLVTLVVLSPWPFGGAHPVVARGIAVVALVTSVVVLGLSWRQPLFLPRAVLWPIAGLWLLGLLQLVPLPHPLHQALAPGSTAVWYPSNPVAAAVLGSGPHPISLHPEATARWLVFSVALVALALLAAPALSERRLALRSAVVVVGGAVLVAVYGLVARLAFGDKLYGVLAVPTIAPFGPFVSKNHFAGYVEMAACLALGLATGLADEARHGPDLLSWLESRRAMWVVVAWGAALVLILVVPISLSRGGVVSLTAGLVVFALVRAWARRSRRGGRWRLPLALAVLAVSGLAVALVLPLEARARVLTVTRATQGGPDAYRTRLCGDSLRLAVASPLLGTGLAAYEDAIPRFKSGAGDLRVEHAENDYVELLAEGGTAAVALVGLILVLGTRRALGAVREEPHRLRRGLYCGALAGIAALLVHSAFDFNLRIPSNALLFALLAAFALAPTWRDAGVCASESPPDRTTEPRGRGPWCWALGAASAGALLLAFAAPTAGRPFDSAQLLLTSGQQGGLRREALERDIVAHLHRRPSDATAWVGLAWLRLPRSPAEATALASWGVALDPRHEALRRAAQRLAGSSSGAEIARALKQPSVCGPRR